MEQAALKGVPLRPTDNFTSRSVLGVDEFMTNVSQYKGPVRIKGVVSAVFPKHQIRLKRPADDANPAS